MKIFIGILSVLLTLGVALLGILAVWGIFPVSGEIIWKTALTLLITAVLFTLIALLFNLFFKKEKIKKKGNNAHLLND